MLDVLTGVVIKEIKMDHLNRRHHQLKIQIFQPSNGNVQIQVVPLLIAPE
jgi:hypothetical protein